MVKVERVVDQRKRLVKLPQQVLGFRARHVGNWAEGIEAIWPFSNAIRWKCLAVHLTWGSKSSNGIWVPMSPLTLPTPQSNLTCINYSASQWLRGKDALPCWQHKSLYNPNMQYTSALMAAGTEAPPRTITLSQSGLSFMSLSQKTFDAWVLNLKCGLTWPQHMFPRRSRSGNELRTVLDFKDKSKDNPTL